MSKNRAAAVIGPMVCDEEGPMPTLNISKTDKNITDCFLAIAGHRAPPVCLVKILVALRKAKNDSGTVGVVFIARR